MMKKRLPWMAVILFSTVLASGCQNYREEWTPYDPLTAVEMTSETKPASSESGMSSVPEPKPGMPSAPAPFQIWGETDTNALDIFKQQHPELDVQYRMQDTIRWESEWIAALAADAGPDVFSYEAERAGWAALLDVFEDLSGPGYALDSLKPLLSEAEWLETESFDRKKRIHLPVYTFPAMLYYRADILEANGFPSEPEALSDYLSNPAKWLDMARTLHAKGHVVMEWKESPWNTGGFVSVPFTSDLTWHMKENRYSPILQTSVTAAREGLAGNINIWVEPDRVALRSDRLVMVQMGSWGMFLLSDWLPDQSGLWRATRLPMGMSAEWGSRWMSMNKNSGNKELAWELMDLTTRTVRSNYANQRNEAYTYYGGQQVFALADQMRLEMKPMLRTPLDRQITDLFWKQLYLVYDGNMPSADYLAYLDKEMESRFAPELSVLRALRDPTE